MAHTIDALRRLPRPAGNRVAIIGTGGGSSVVAADACSQAGLDVPPISADARAELRKTIPAAGNIITNPVDAHDVMTDPAQMPPVLEVLSTQDYLDMVVVYFHVDWMYDVAPDRIARAGHLPRRVGIRTHERQTPGRNLAVLPFGTRIPPDHPGDAGDTGRRRHPPLPRHRLHRPDTGPAGRILDIRGLGEGNVMEPNADLSSRDDEMRSLSEFESGKVLESYGIPVVATTLATTPSEAVEAAAGTGYPVVLKGCSPDLTHKSEAGAVKLNLTTSAEVASAFTAIETAAAGALDGILVQPQIKGARELVAGMIRDPQFGPCVMFGLGGIFTEVLDDACFRIAPLEERGRLGDDGQHPRLGNPRPRPRHSTSRPLRPIQNPHRPRLHRPGERPDRSHRRQPPPTTGERRPRGSRRRHLAHPVTGS